MKKIIYIIVASSLMVFSVNAAPAKSAVKKTTAKSVKTTTKVAEVKPVARVVISPRTVSANEQRAIGLYQKALDNYNSKKYSSALTEVNQAASIIGHPTSRLAYLEAKIAYAMEDYKTARAACVTYFESNPCKDSGYEELSLMSAILNKYFINKQAEDERQAQLKIDEQQRKAEEKELAKKVENANIAAARENKKARNAALRQERIEKVNSALDEARAKNTRAAYQEFIDNYPFGRAHQTALDEMNAKWPYPIRTLNKKNKYGYTDKSGSFVIKAKYDNATEFQDERARVGLNGMYGYVDEKGNEVVPLIYKSAGSYSFGFAAVKEGKGQAYYIDKSGKKLANKEFREAKPFSEGYAAVADEYFKYGFINTSGDLVIANQYDVVGSFHNGIAYVGKKENGKFKYAYIDTDGELLTDFLYEEAKDFQYGTARVKKSGKYALVDNNGSQLCGFVYDFITEFRNDGYARARRENVDVLLDRYGMPWANVNGNMIQVKFKNN